MLNFLQTGASGAVVSVSPMIVLINIVLSFVLTMLIAYIYKKTHTGLSYSRSFVFTLVLMGVLISVVMMVIGNSIAAAFTLLGAFTIIRFRTAVKETRDISFVFWALVTGMAVGTNNYVVAILMTALIIAIVLIMTKMNFGSMKNYDHVLMFFVDTGITDGNIYKELFDRYLKHNSMININSREEGKMLDFTFNVRFINDDDVNTFVTNLKNLNGISNVSLMTAKNDIEY